MGARLVLVPFMPTTARRDRNRALVRLSGIAGLLCLLQTGVAAQPTIEFGTPRGYQAEPFDLELRASPAETRIWYTLDGHRPDGPHGRLYERALRIDRTTIVRAIAILAGDSSAVHTATYLFPTDILSQVEAAPSGAFWSTAMDPEVTGLYTRSELEGFLKELPTLSLVVEPEDLFHPDGIYWKTNLEGPSGFEAERPASLEWIYPLETYAPGQFRSFQVNAGLRIQGGGSRLEQGRWNAKQSFTVVFRSRYGPPRLRQPVFRTSVFHGDTEAGNYDRLILRAGFNKAWSAFDYGNFGGRPYDHFDDVYARDQWGRDTQISMTGYGARGTYVHLFLNGLYWGLYNPTERPDQRFSADYFGGRPEEWSVFRNRGGAVAGDSSRVRSLVETVSNSQDIAAVRRVLDVEGFADWMLLAWYAGLGDIQWYAVHHAAVDGPTRFIGWDLEDCLIRLEGRSNDGAWIHNYGEEVATIFRNLWNWNRDFRMTFVDRAYAHLHGNGALTDAASLERWDRLTARIEGPVVLESARWGDERRRNPYWSSDFGKPTYTREAHWRPARDRVTAMLAGNAERFLALLRAAQYYPALEPPEFSEPAGPASPGTRLTISNGINGGTGTLYYTLDGSDPRASGDGYVSAGAQAGGQEATIPLSGTVTVSARVYVDETTWSPLRRSTFYHAMDSVAITEIMYRPAPAAGDESADADRMQFIELRNDGSLPVDLTGYALQRGMVYRFPNLRIPPRRELVVARDPQAFRERYGFDALGPFEGRLDPTGATLQLIDPAGRLADAVTYAHRPPWPLSGDDRGHSIELIDPALDNSRPENWRRSARAGGSPRRDHVDGRSVEMARYEVQETGPGEVLLFWSTTRETNNAGFAVESALDGAPFQELGWVFGGGLTDEVQVYSYTIVGLDFGPRHFRLIQVDLDGTRNPLSELPISLTIPGDHLVDKPYPNPFLSEVRLRYVLRQAGTVQAALYSLLGQRVRQSAPVESPANVWQEIAISGSGLASGTYVLRLVGLGFETDQLVVLAR